jgi:hypothetical protein
LNVNISLFNGQKKMTNKKIKGLTVKTKLISGFQIVTGISELAREPKATGRHSAEEILKLPVSKEYVLKNIEKVAHIRNYRAAFKDEDNQLKMVKAKEKELDLKKDLRIDIAQKHVHNPEQYANALNDCDCVIKDCEMKIDLHTKKAAAANKKYHDEQAASEAANSQLKEIGVRFKKAEKDFKRENPIFSEPRAGELVDSDILICVPDTDGLPVVRVASEIDADKKTANSEHVSFLIPDVMVTDEVDGQPVETKLTAQILAKLFFSKGDNQQLKLDGEYVEDFRGEEYFFKVGDQWQSEPVITELGVTKSTVVADEYEEIAIEKKDLTPEQSEEIRIQNLSAEDKQAEFEMMRTGLGQQAQAMENDLKYQQVSDYVEQAQTWYDAELDKLKLKYGITT